ncbi:hypothetical protein ABT097_05605 [Streptomyces sp. NPDC002225]|uniref:hypothetical protein n=1 Tax=Streptomyces sp. NPDC002225 TaxID=3154413 RepID=UPI0033209375
MSSHGRSAGSVFCIVLAMLSITTAVILSAIALSTASQVSDPPLDEFSNEVRLLEDADCDTKADTAPDQLFMSCFFKHRSTMQKDAVRWEREIAARQSSVQAKGNLAVVFGLLGVTFAVCAVAANRTTRQSSPDSDALNEIRPSAT